MIVSSQFEWRQRNRLLDEGERLKALLAELRRAATSRAEYEPHDIIDDEAAIQADAIEQRLGAIETALQHLDSGTYGRCRSCEGAIAAERLEALPAVGMCLRCAG